MSLLKSALVGLLVLLLALDLAAANAVVAAERTVLDADFVTRALDEADAYAELQAFVVEELPRENVTGEDVPPLPVDTTEVLERALPPAYIRNQTEATIEGTYAYLHGEAAEPDLTIDLEPAKAAAVDAVEAELTEASASELLSAVGGDLVNLTFEQGGVSVSLSTMVAMSENESRFEAEREAVRETVRASVVDRLVDETFAAATNDELLALVIEDYDPNDYTEAEKDRLVEDKEVEIRAALAERIRTERADEVEAAVDEALAQARTAARDRVSTVIEGELGDVDPAVADAVEQLALVGIDGLLDDTTYVAYRTDFEAAVDALAAAASSMLAESLAAEVPDEFDLGEELGPEADAALADAREAVGLLDLLTLTLPLAGLGLLTGIYLVSRSAVTTTLGAGLSLVVGGLPALVGASQLRPRLEAVLAGGDLPPALVDLALALADRVADAVVVQSAVVVMAGVVLVVTGLAIRHGRLEGGGAGGTGPGENMGDE